MRPSLRQQLLLWLLVPLGALLLFNAWTTWRSAQSAASSVQDRMLLGSARIIAEQVGDEDGDLKTEIPPAALELFQSQVPDHVYFRVATDGGLLLSGFADLPAVPAPAAGQMIFFDGSYRNEPVRIVAYAQPVLTASPQATVLVEVAQTLRGHDAFAGELLRHALRQQFLMLLCVAGLLWIGLQRGLAPMLRLRARMLARPPGSLEPLDTADVPVELNSLVAAINDYVRRLDEHMSVHSRFIANASHQLRTPLTVLNTQVSAALRSTSAGDRDEALRAIHASVQHGIRLVNQLLSLSAAEARARQAAASTEVDLAATVQQVLEDLALLAQGKAIDLGFEQEGAAACVRGSPAMLRELVANLVDNALRYTPAGGRVTASVRGGGGVVELRVEDNGPGIPEGERERIFERFYRLHDRHSDGSGLGLAIVREIAGACQARVTLGEPPSGSGLVATVLFPAPPARS